LSPQRCCIVLVSLETLYGYGAVGGRPMTEDLPLAATGVKGRVRAAMTVELRGAADAGRVRIAIGRASDFFGPGVTEGALLGERVFGNALAGRHAAERRHRRDPSLVPDPVQNAVMAYPEAVKPGESGQRSPQTNKDGVQNSDL
jgi:hypothetical protein